MLFRPVRLEDERLGRLWLSSMPGRLEGWPRFVQEARDCRLSLVLCLTPLHEVAQLSPAYRLAIEQQSLPFRWVHVPMRDLGLSAQFEDFRSAVLDAAATLQSGGDVLLHCAAGIGRTGTAAACLLKHLGQPTPVALQRVRDAGSNPESALQSGLVEKF